ncbi:MAG: TetR/AcrR family transcriptional regulator [Deltaproteobacteria bacterium]
MEKVRPSLKGRPKVLDRDRVLSVAMEQYWRHGPTKISVNDICKLSGSSKPAVYREFGSDDGLKAAALLAYKAVAIDPFLARLHTSEVLSTTLNSLIEFIMQDRRPLQIPDGCLFVSMKAQRHCFGPITQACLDKVRTHFVSSFANWIDSSKSAGEFRQDIPTSIAVYQIEALHAGAASLQREGAPSEEVKQMLTFGLAAISGEDRILS